MVLAELVASGYSSITYFHSASILESGLYVCSFWMPENSKSAKMPKSAKISARNSKETLKSAKKGQKKVLLLEIVPKKALLGVQTLYVISRKLFKKAKREASGKAVAKMVMNPY